MSRPRRRGGYTLLEVLLVLLITSVLVTAVAAAINIYLRAVEAGRAEVEQAQLARALLRRIADDLRSAVPIVVDSSGGESLSSSASAAATSAAQAGVAASAGGDSTSGGSVNGTSSTGGTSGVTNITGSTGVTNIGGSSGSGSSGSNSAGSSSAGRSSGGTSGGSSTGSSGGTSSGTSSSGSNSNTGATSEDSASEESAVAAPPLGVYGSQYDLQIDVSRLPRTDRIDSLTGMIAPTDAATAGDPPSDVKTVAYYISSVASAYNAADDTAAAGSSRVGGLIRRQIDRSIVNFGTLNGGTAADTNEQMLAPEATAIEFRYFDGTEWLTSWDSSDRQAVPVAVEIVLTMRTTMPTDDVGSTLSLGAAGLPEENTYRLLVHLPAGQASTAGAAALEEAMSSSTEAAP